MIKREAIIISRQPREFVGSNPTCFLMRIAMENFGISLLPISPNWLDTVI